jgi:hypothetical protein
MDLKTIVVTWMDGKTATYQDASSQIINGVLNIYTYYGIRRTVLSEWHFPISNIRAWGPGAWNPDEH